MGREITVQAKINNKIIYENYICGRDDATNYIASLICDALKNKEEPDEDASEEEWNNYYGLTFFLHNKDDKKELTNILENLKGYAQSDLREIQKAKEELEDLRAARRNCRKIKEFYEFSNSIEQVRN